MFGIPEKVSIGFAIVKTRRQHMRDVDEIARRYQERFSQGGETPELVSEFYTEVITAFARSVADYSPRVKEGIMALLQQDSDRNQRKFKITGKEEYRIAAYMNARRAQAVRKQLEETLI